MLGFRKRKERGWGHEASVVLLSASTGEEAGAQQNAPADHPDMTIKLHRAVGQTSGSMAARVGQAAAVPLPHHSKSKKWHQLESSAKELESHTSQLAAHTLSERGKASVHQVKSSSRDLLVHTLDTHSSFSVEWRSQPVNEGARFGRANLLLLAHRAAPCAIKHLQPLLLAQYLELLSCLHLSCSLA